MPSHLAERQRRAAFTWQPRRSPSTSCAERPSTRLPLLDKQSYQGVRWHRRHNPPPTVLDDSLLERQPRVSVPGMRLVLRREPAFEQGGLRIIRSLSEMLRVGHLFSLTDRTELPLGTHSSGLI